MKFDHDKFIDLYKSAYGALDNIQTSGLRGLLGFCEKDNHVSDVRWTAYMLATVKHECGNRWQPIEECGKGRNMAYGTPVRVKGNDGKIYTNTYYGRGYVQLTWVDNYRKMSYNLNLGDDILVHPERALEASIAYRIMSFGMRNGSFTGVCLSDCISRSKCDYHGARQIINVHDQAPLIQGYAQKLEALLRESSDGRW
jgi:putative chitinase